MHELSIAQNIIEIVRSEMEKAGAARLKRVTLTVGPFAGINNESLAFGFEALVDKTDLDGARLDITTVTEKGVCSQCGQQVEIADPFALCPKCGGVRIEVAEHHDLRIEEIEVD